MPAAPDPQARAPAGQAHARVYWAIAVVTAAKACSTGAWSARATPTACSAEPVRPGPVDAGAAQGPNRRTRDRKRHNRRPRDVRTPNAAAAAGTEGAAGRPARTAEGTAGGSARSGVRPHPQPQRDAGLRTGRPSVTVAAKPVVRRGSRSPNSLARGCASKGLPPGRMAESSLRFKHAERPGADAVRFRVRPGTDRRPCSLAAVGPRSASSRPSAEPSTSR